MAGLGLGYFDRVERPLSGNREAAPLQILELCDLMNPSFSAREKGRFVCVSFV